MRKNGAGENIPNVDPSQSTGRADVEMAGDVQHPPIMPQQTRRPSPEYLPVCDGADAY
jgi:hypothetical protein